MKENKVIIDKRIAENEELSAMSEVNVMLSGNIKKLATSKLAVEPPQEDTDTDTEVVG
jgi:hypothetical protein